MTNAPNESKLTEAEIAFYREHPELVAVIGDRTAIHQAILAAVFAIGFLLVVLSKVVKQAVIDSPTWVTETAVDLLFELGVALWGGVATTVLLQDLMTRQYREGRRLQQSIIEKLSETHHEQRHG